MTRISTNCRSQQRSTLAIKLFLNFSKDSLKTISLLIILTLSLTIFVSCGNPPDIAAILQEPLPENTLNFPEENYKKSINDINLAKKNIQAKEDIYNSYLTLGNAYSTFELHEKALAVYDQTTKEFPQGLVAWLNKASTLEDLKRYQEAAKSYEAAIKLGRTDQAYFRLGVVLRQYLKAPDKEIRAHYDKAISDLGYRSIFVSDYLGYLYFDRKDKAAADKVLEEALKAEPKDPKFIEIKASYDNL